MTHADNRSKKALSSPEAYPERPRRIELVQTHISLVFIADDYVYKVKKPVDFGFLDFTTLEKRRFYCQREVELNRRLCPNSYLGVVEIVEGKNGIRIGGEGETIEYAVKMRKLPQERMMDWLLREGGVTEGMVEEVAGRVADFHRRAETGGKITAYGGIEAVLVNIEENRVQTEKYIGTTIPKETYRKIEEYNRRFVEREAPLFQGRMEGGRVRDCHGDLHAAHICFADDICIYDCIEFNDRFRYADVASEVAFLAMDLDYHGRRDLGERFVSAYVERSGDGELLKLLDFYKCYRAYVRGKVESFKLDDPQVPGEEKGTVRGVASRYFALAESYCI